MMLWLPIAHHALAYRAVAVGGVFAVYACRPASCYALLSVAHQATVSRYG